MSLPTFADSFRQGQNHFGVLRHMLAVLVLTDHAWILTGRSGALSATEWQTSLGSLAVACFFLLSGALVTASWLQQPSLTSFLRKRALRLLPGYLVCLLVTVVIIAPLAWLLEYGDLSTYWITKPGPLGYLLRNSLLLQWQPEIAGLFANHAEAGSINGSLWSIPWEAGCYGVVAVLGITGVLKQYQLLVPILAGLVLVNVVWFPPGSVLGMIYLSERVVLLPMYFLCGAAFYLYRQRIPRSSAAGWLAIAGVAVGGCFNWPLTALICMPYAFFFLATTAVTDLKTKQRSWPDISYGIYIYGFPLQQLLLSTGISPGAPTTSPLALLIQSTLLVLPVAWLSWILVEAPALRFKPIS